MRISDEELERTLAALENNLRRSNEGHLVAAQVLCLDPKDARKEIARLRDAVNVALGHHTGGMDGDWRNCDLIDLLRSVLADEPTDNSSHTDSDGTGYCRGCGTTINEAHHPFCDIEPTGNEDK